jgi:hypothetical protein
MLRLSETHLSDLLVALWKEKQLSAPMPDYGSAEW